MSILPPSPFVSFTVSPGELCGSLPSGESEPSVTLARSPGESASSMSTGGTKEAPAGANMGSASAGLLVDGPDIPLAELVRRGFDEEGFLNDLERLPAFLSAPSQEYLKANELMPVLHALAGR